MKQQINIFFVVLICASLLSSCSKDLAQNGIPAYLRIDSVQVTGDTRFGVISNDVFGVQIDVGADSRGIWQLKSLIPVLNEGDKNLVMYPYVKVNNLSNNFIQYPFLTYDARLHNFSAKRVDTVVPKFTYQTDTRVVLIEEFENNSNFSNGTVSVISKNGLGSLKIVANRQITADSSTVSVHVSELALNPGKEIYLEFDYYMPSGALMPSISFTDANGSVRNLFADNFLKSNSGWQHVYWRFSSLVGYANVSKGYVSFSLLKNDVPNGEVYIDNLKLLER
jgi:hypothetical protein